MTPRSETLQFNNNTPEVIQHPYPGLYIAFEGPEGGGKTTQRDYLSKSLENIGVPHFATREPGGSAIGRKLRAMLLEDFETPPANQTEVYLFAADRSEHIAQYVTPALKQGKVVLSDRSFYSSIAYQGAARGMGMDAVWQINKMAVGNIVPDLIIYMDIEPEEGLKRRLRTIGANKAPVKADRLDLEKLEFHKNAHIAFKILQAKDPTRWFSVPSSLTPQEQRVLIILRVEKELAMKGIKMIKYVDGSKNQRSTST